MLVPAAAPVYEATRRVIDQGLRRDGSAFTPGRQVWTASNAADLHERFVDAPELGPSRFVEKLSRQLDGAPRDTVMLMAELTYLYLLPPIDMGGAAKRRLLADVVELVPDPPPIPAELDAALDVGFARAGTAYHTQRDRQLAWLVRFVEVWKGSHLVYAGGKAEVTHHTVLNDGPTLHIHALDLSVPIPDIHTQIQTLAAALDAEAQH